MTDLPDVPNNEHILAENDPQPVHNNDIPPGYQSLEDQKNIYSGNTLNSKKESLSNTKSYAVTNVKLP